MEKDKILKIAEDLYKVAFDANAYFLIMQQFRDLRIKYDFEIRVSPAFYSTVYAALLKACFMDIAKLYDLNSKSITIGYLLRICVDNITLFNEYREIKAIKENGQEDTDYYPYHHKLRANEECFFEKQVQIQRNFNELNGISGDVPIIVDLKFSELLSLFQNCLSSFSKKIENVRNQRNKIYAHNNEEKVENIDAVFNKYPISYDDLEELIVFALDCTRLIIGNITGVQKATEYSNIDDWEGTLMYVKLGQKYQYYDIEKNTTEFIDKLKRNKAD